MIKVDAWTLLIGAIFCSSFISKYDDFVLIDGTHNINIYDLNLVVTTVIDSLGTFVSVGFLVAPSEHSQSIKKKYLLRIFQFLMKNHQSCIMIDEGLVLVNMATSLSNFCRLFCGYHVNALAIQVRTYISGLLIFFK